ncbi:MAG: RluA family pseudouridine synthase [Firmicutes bacterium]|nr:RluA family pseudouridine synthase [Bacillota bacterium]
MGGRRIIRIIYEDNHLLVVEKPVNVLTQGDITGDEDLLTILKEDIKKRYNKPGNVYLGLVHRLDRPVGGVMVFAKTSKAASRLSDQIRTGSFEKSYLAVIYGTPDCLKGRLEHYLIKDNRMNKVYVVDNAEKGGKKAILEYEVLKSKGNMSLVKINLLTGRPHQIRVQFATMGYPLYGDQKYNAGLSRAGEQLALWSYVVRLIHPVKKEKMAFQSNPPETYPWNVFNFLF